MPVSADGTTAPPPEQLPPPDTDNSFTLGDLFSIINAKSPHTGAGIDGWRYKDLQLLFSKLDKSPTLGDNAATKRGLLRLVTDITNGVHNTPELRPLLTRLRGVALRKKKGAEDIRPIGIGQLFTSIAAALLARGLETKRLLPDGVGPTELAHGVKGGTEALPHVTRAYLALNPTHVAISTDIENAFGSLYRVDAIQASKVYPHMANMVNLLYVGPTEVVYDQKTTITTDRGVTQGDPLAGILFSTKLKSAVDATLAAHPTVTIAGIADDRTLFAPIDDALDAIKTYEVELAKMGLKLQRAKTKVYAPSGRDTIAEACKAAGVEACDGFDTGGAPVGTAAFVQASLRKAVDCMSKHALDIADVYVAGVDDGVKLQDIFRIMRWCLAPGLINHLLRTTPTVAIEQQAARFDDAVYAALMKVLSVDAGDANASPATRKGALVVSRAQLLASSGGLGLTSAKDTAPSAFLGSQCLTAHIVKKLLGDGFDSASDAGIAFPELAAAFADGTLTRANDKLSLAGLLERPTKRVQKCLGRLARPGNLKAVLDSIEDPDAKAWLLNSGKEGAAFLLAWPTVGRGLSNAQFDVLLRVRLGLPIVAKLDEPVPCPRCGPTLRAGSHVPALHPDGLHVLCCREPGKGGAKGKTTCRHAHANHSLQAGLKRVANRANDEDPVRHEPPLRPIWREKPSYTEPVNASDRVKNPRGDLAVTIGPNIIVADLVIIHQSVRSCPLASSVEDALVDAAANRKQNLYNNRFDIPSGQFVPLAVAAGGRFHRATRAFIAKFVGANMPTGTASNSAEWSPMIKSLYSSRIRDVANTLSIAVARSVANSLIDGASFLRPRSPTLPHTVPATAVDDGDDAHGWGDDE